jgi:hypothetical protein
MSPKTTPMLPSVSAQKPVVTEPSRASVDVTLTVIALENALSVDLIRAGYRRLRETCQRSSIAPPIMPAVPAKPRFAEYFTVIW